MSARQDRTRHVEDLELVAAHLAAQAAGMEPETRRAASAQLAQRLMVIPKFLTVINRRKGGRLTPESVDDLSQDVLVEVLRKIGSFRGEASLESWLYKIASRRYSNRVRDEARRESAMNDYVSESWVQGPSGVVPCEPQELPAATKALPRESRAILEAKWLRGLTFREIALELGGSTNTIKTRYYRSLAVLARSVGIDL